MYNEGLREKRQVTQALIPGQDITFHMSRLDPPIRLAEPKNEDLFHFVQSIQLERIEWTDEIFDAAESLWKDAGVQEAYRRSDEYPLIDCAK